MKVLISGLSGQDGSYLAEQLLEEHETVTGLILHGERLPAYVEALRAQGLQLLNCDLADPAAFRHVLREHRPQRLFHLAAISSPTACTAQPQLSQAVNVTSVEVICDWLKREQPEARVLLASSAAIFSPQAPAPQSEAAATAPAMLYGRQKLAVRELAAESRQDGHFVACAIAFNHESPRRSEDFVFAKICNSAARIYTGQQERLVLGDVQARRDWGYAPEYVTAMRWMLEIEKPVELVLATGECHSVFEIVQQAFTELGLDPKSYVESDPALSRADDVQELVGDATRAWEELGWEATTKFSALVRLMVQAGRAAA